MESVFSAISTFFVWLKEMGTEVVDFVDFSVISTFFVHLKEIWTVAIGIVNNLPPVMSFIIRIAFYLAMLGIVCAHVKAVICNHDMWLSKFNSSLVFSYFCGTGQYRRTYIYKHAYSFLLDKTWLLFSAAGVAYRIGKYESESKFKLILLSFVHIPMKIIGFFEMIFRVVFGCIYLMLANIAHWLMLAIIQIITSLMIPIWSLIDGGMRTEQHCTYCYRSFKVPGYVCPSCQKIHNNLVPGKTGIWVARCECGKFLSSALVTGRSRLDSVCPECMKPLAATDAQEFNIQLIGSNASGKTAFLSAFQHMYRTVNANNAKVSLHPFPEKNFDELERMFMDGITSESYKASIVAYSIVHEYASSFKNTLVVYDVPDEALINGIYEQNPLNFAYTDGILIVIDPTSIKHVRQESEKKGEIIPEGSYASDEAEAEDIIVGFIQQFSAINNRFSNQRSKTPVAVVINKADLSVVRSEIGQDAIKSTYQADLENYAAVRNKVCRDYILSIGLANAINNLESVFSNVQYFSVSAIGHESKEGIPFSPINVIEPMEWIVGKKNMRMRALLNVARKMS